MSRTAIVAVFAAVMTIVCISAGCDNAPRSMLEKGKAVKIVVVGPSRDDPDWPIVEACAKTALSTERNVAVEVRGPASASPVQQREILAALVDESVDVICLMPIDADAVRPELDRLARSGRGVVTIGRDVRDSARAAFVGPHEEDVGNKAGEAALAWLDEARRSVVIVGAVSPNGPRSVRYFAAKDRLRRGIAQILREIDTSASPWNAADQVRDEAAKYPRVACWLFLDEWPLVSDKVWKPLVPETSNVVVCGMSPRWFGRLKRREIHALIGYDLQQAVESGLQTAVHVARRDEFGQKGRDLPVEVFTMENIKTLERRRKLWEKGERAGPNIGLGL